MLGKIFKKIKSQFEPRAATLIPLGMTFEVASDQTLLQGALAAGLAFPHHCTVGTCGNCKCRLKEGDVRPLMDTSLTLTQAEVASGYILACQCMLKSAVTVEVDLAIDTGNPESAQHMGTITAIEELTYDILRVCVELDAPLEFLAGQFADIGLPGFGRHRSYSFANPPVAGGSTAHEFIVRKVSGGKYTQWLFAQERVGERFELHGPQGSFWLRPASVPLVCVAGGSGMAPILSILEDMLSKHIERPVAFFFGARQSRDLYCLEQLKSIEQQWPCEFLFIPVLSEEPESSDWTGARGMVTEYLDDEYSGFAIADSHAYLCGPPPMIDAALEQLQRCRLATEHTHYDKFLDSRQIEAAQQ
jgi:NAD(P)H-flavin reductase/ferredoxin